MKLHNQYCHNDRVATIAARILNSNNDYEEIKNKKWTISVIDQEDKNAFVLPSGNIFVFTGMINSQYVYQSRIVFCDPLMLKSDLINKASFKDQIKK